jgi:hypothetical protein
MTRAVGADGGSEKKAERFFAALRITAKTIATQAVQLRIAIFTLRLRTIGAAIATFWRRNLPVPFLVQNGDFML